MKKLLLLAVLVMASFSNFATAQIIISGFTANPASTDGNNEYIQLVATQAIDFAVTPYSVVVANNGTATTQGWAAGGTVTFKFDLTSGSVVAGQIFYVGGSGKLIDGAGSTDISGATWIRTITITTTGGDGFGTGVTTAGVVGNGGANADGIGVFSGTSVTNASVPIDAVFYGSAIGTAYNSGTGAGYLVPDNDLYNGGLFGSAGSDALVANPLTDQFVDLEAKYDTNTNTWIGTRTGNPITLTTSSPLSAIEDVSMSGGIISLPISIQSATATVNPNGVTLAWVTATETNSQSFIIEERMNDQWSALGTLAAAGNSTTPRSYTFNISNSAKGLHVYRIKEVDASGTIKVSKEIAVLVDLPDTFDLGAAYPNPFTASATFNVAVASRQNVSVALYNVLGQKVQTLFEGTLEANEIRRIAIDGAQLPSGQYFYAVEGQGFSAVKSVALIR